LANDILRFGLLLVAAVALLTAGWVDLLALQKTGRRYWLINPMARLETIFTKESGIFLICMVLAAGSLVLRDMLK
jgi:hypothetical protein